MSREGYEIFNDIRREKQERRAKRLARTDDFGWSKHSDTHWYRMIDGEKLHYWPSANKWLYKGRYYRGGLPKELGKKIDEDNAVFGRKIEGGTGLQSRAFQQSPSTV